MGYCRIGRGDRRGDVGGGDGGGCSTSGSSVGSSCGDGGCDDDSGGGGDSGGDGYCGSVCCCCCCCDMSGLGIIDGMGMTRYRMTTSSGTGTVGISRVGNPSSPSPGTSNGCKPHTSHYRTTSFSFFVSFFCS